MDTYASLLEFSTSADEQRTQFVRDFNPSVDKIRVTSDAGMNLRLNADEGTLLLGDGNLNLGMPRVIGSAYANDVDHDGMGDESQDPDGGGLGLDWEDDWFEDSLITASTWWAMGTRSGGEVITLD